MSWRDRLPKQESAFDTTVKVEILRRLYGHERPVGPLLAHEQRVMDSV